MGLWMLRLRNSLTSVTRLPLGGLKALGCMAQDLGRKIGPLPPLLVVVHPSPEMLLQLEALERPVFIKQPVLILLRCSKLPVLSLPFDNLITFAMVSEGDDNDIQTINLFQQYSVAHGHSSSVLSVGTWSPATGVVPVHPDEAARRRDLQGIELRCLYINEEPGEVDVWTTRLLEVLEYHLNFSCRYKPTADGEYGALREDGSWSGMVGDLYSGEGDIIVMNLDNTVTRSQVVHFLLANDVTGTLMVMKKTTSLDSSWSHYTSEFSSGVWWTLTLALAAMTLVLYVVVRGSPSESQRLTVLESFMEVIGAFGSQSSVRNYNSYASRAALLVTFTSAFLVVAHYSSWLYAMLTVQTTSYLFHGFQSVLDDGSYVVGVVEGWATKTELQCSKDPLLQKVWTDLVKDKGVVGSLAEGLQRTLDEKLILLVGKQSFLLDTNFDKNKFTVLPGVYFLWPTGFATTKDSPYTETLNKGLSRLRTSGVLQKLLSDRTKPNLVAGSTDSVSGVSLQQTMSLFSLLAIAAGLSLFLLALEILLHRYKARNEDISQCSKN